MAVEDTAERERLELEDRLNDFIIALGLGSAFELEHSRPGSSYLFAVQGVDKNTFHPYYLYEQSGGEIAYSEAAEEDLKWALRHGVERVDLPEHIARWYTLIGIDHRHGGDHE